MKKRVDTIIIGAGLAGLACAYRLKRRYRIVEETNEVGGLCTTDVQDGFRFDKTGHLLHLRKGAVRSAVLALLDAAPLTIERRARIFSHGSYTHYPFQANTFGLPKEVVSECLTGFIEAQVRKAGDTSRPQSFEEFILRHFGEGIAKHFMIPYNAKLWGVHPRDVTSDWCTRFVPVPDIASVVEGAVGRSDRQMGYNASFFYPETGIGALPAAFARRVPDVELSTSPDAIDLEARRIHIGGEWVSYRAIANTMPLSRFLEKVVSPMPEEIRDAAGRLQCTRLRYLDVALNRPAGTEHHWTYVPERRFPFYRVGSYTNFSEALAPPGCGSLYVELTSRQPVRLATLMPRVISGLTEMGVIRGASDIRFVRPRLIQHAYVIYNFDYETAVPRLHQWLATKRVFNAGRYASWEYAAMEDAVSQGFEAAEKIKNLD